MRSVFVFFLWMMELGCMAQSVVSDSLSRTYDYYFLEAIVQREKGNHDAAYDLLKRCVELDSLSSAAYFYLSQYEAGLKHTDKVLEYKEKAAELDPDNSFFLETLAQSYVASNKLDDAALVLERLYDRNKDRLEILEMLYQIYQQQKDYPKAISSLERLELADGKSERIAYAKSDLYTQLGDKKAAIAEMKSLSDQHPNDDNYRTLYADMLMMNGQEKKAVSVLKDVLAANPSQVHALLSMRSFYKSKNDTVAVKNLTEQILLSPTATTEERVYLMRQEVAETENLKKDSTRILNLFRSYMALPRPDVELAAMYAAYMGLKKMPQDSIAKVLERILEIAPDNAAARLQLVSYAWKAEDTQRIIDLCSAARQYNPDEMAFYYYQGMAYYQRKENDKALETFKNGIGVANEQSDPAIVSDFYAVMGDLFHERGLVAEAYAAYDSCLQWKDDNIMCLNNYAYYLSMQGEQLDKAETMSLKTVKADPKNATYLDTYAWILFMQARYAEARIYIDQALQNDTDSNAVITEHAGDIYALNNDMDKALAFWQEALKKAPDNQVLIRKIRQKKYIKE